MKILFDLRPAIDAPRGGVGRVTAELAKAWLQAFPEDHVIFFTSGWDAPTLPEHLVAPNTVHRHLHIPNKLLSAPCIIGATSIVRLARRQDPNIDAAIFPNLGFTGRLDGPVPTALLLHDVSFRLEPRWFTWKQRIWHRLIAPERRLREAAALFSVSKRTAEDAYRLFGIGRGRIAAIPLGPTDIARHVAAIQPTEAASPRTILVFGNGDARKNADGAMKAIEILRQDPAFADLEIETPKTNDDEVATQIAHAAVVLYPSWYEGFGLPPHEAAAVGTPAVVSIHGATPETAPAGTFFAPAAKSHLIAAALRQALERGRRTPISAPETRWEEAARLIRDRLIRRTP